MDVPDNPLTPLLEDRFHHWRENLIDLSRRNPLISLRPSRRRQLSLIRPETPILLDRLFRLRTEFRFRLPEVSDGDSEPAKKPRFRADELQTESLDKAELFHILTHLYRQARSDFLERGLNSLCFVAGMLEWLENGVPVRSPLILLPVQLVRSTPTEMFHLRAMDDEPVLNPALVARLQKDFQLRLPPLPDFSQEDSSLATWFHRLTQSITSLDGWKVEKTSMLALLSFDKSVMHHDLLTNQETIARSPLIRSLAGEPGEMPIPSSSIPAEDQLDDVQTPEDYFFVLDADASQRRAVEAARRGQSFVLFGPPGTGKSQTITNLIADRIATGGTVLFVSEKMAALDVVHRRLQNVGLGEFCLELHSPQVSRVRVVQELYQSLVNPPKIPGSRFDFGRFQQKRQTLNGFVASLHQIREPLGISVFQALEEVIRHGDQPLLELTRDRVDPRQKSALWLDGAMLAVRRLSRVGRLREEGQSFVWWGFRSENGFSLELRERVRATLERGIALSDRLHDLLDSAQKVLTIDSEEKLLQLGDLLENRPEVPLSWLGVSPGLIHRLREEIARFDEMQRCLKATRQQFANRYGVGFGILPIGTAQKVETAWRGIEPLLLPESSGRLLRQRLARLRDWLWHERSSLPDRERDLRQLFEWFGITPNHLTLRRVDLLLELFTRLTDGHQPPVDWLHPPVRDRVSRLLIDLRHDPELFHLRDELLNRYDDRLFRLPLDRLAEKFRGIYAGWWRLLSPSWRSDRDAVRNVHRRGEVPTSVADDLMRAREVSRREERLRATHGDAMGFLGIHSAAMTSFGSLEAAEKALRNTDRVLEILRSLEWKEIPPRLLELCRGSLPLDIAGIVTRLRNSTNLAATLTTPLKEILPLESLPQTRIPLSDSPFESVRQYVEPLYAAHLNLESALAAVGPGGEDFAGIVADLRQSELMRAWVDAADADPEYQVHRWGESWKGLEATAWKNFDPLTAWAEALRGIFPEEVVPMVVVEWLRTGKIDLPRMEEVRAARRELQQIRGEISSWFGSDPFREVDALSQMLERFRDSLDELPDWFDWRDLPPELDRLGLSHFADELKSKKIAADRYIACFRRSFLTFWVDAITADDPALKDFRGDEHELIQSDFRKLDEEYIRTNPLRIAEKALARRPEALSPSPGSELEILTREALKSVRHIPLLQLFCGMPKLLQQLRPCLLMSPITVSQFLMTSPVRFDLVIFDEASQIPVEDSLGAIWRGRQVIIVGDDKQLPPTSFFQSGHDPNAEVAPTDFPSILDQTRSILPSHMLRWHYRSRDESLIAFSNREFYDSRLVTFPAAGVSTSDRGVSFRYVEDGVYDRGGRRDNRREAEVVAEMVFEQLQKHPEKTVGVIAFSQAQMIAIDNQIEKRRRGDASFEAHFRDDRLESVFIRNLETVQGDERDVIFLSVGYGKDDTGKPSLNFGPLNRAGGEKRLNVAVTRAREKLVVISSLTAADLQSRHIGSEGMRLVRKYLRYAEGGSEIRTQLSTRSGRLRLPPPASDLLEDVRGELAKFGLEGITDVGIDSRQIDLAVRDPKRPEVILAGILIDGVGYGSAVTATDRDRIRPKILADFGWKLHLIRTLDWVRNRRREVERLKKCLEVGRGKMREGRRMKAEG